MMVRLSTLMSLAALLISVGCATPRVARAVDFPNHEQRTVLASGVLRQPAMQPAYLEFPDMSYVIIRGGPVRQMQLNGQTVTVRGVVRKVVGPKHSLVHGNMGPGEIGFVLDDCSLVTVP